MPAHDFARLSSYDFQELIGDLLQADWCTRLESFTPGPDSGIDLRHLTARQDSIVIQCKHSVGVRFREFLSHIRRDERPKVRRLAPKRYVLATSRGLTPANKKQLAALLHPYVKKESDILGRDDVNNLLRLHPSVETNNFKLWLTSAAVLDRVLHNAERCQTEFEIDRVCRKLPLFVQNDAFPRAQNILADSRIVVISGVPGIGKTTLADMLLYAHLERGYEPVVIQGEIAEARKLFKKTVRQIFYFDDFLGQTFLQDRPDILGKNQDAALISFFDAVRASKGSRFIMTTREHILKKALAISERLSRSPILDHRCILELSDYSFAQKARILYNHLYFSDLPRSYKEAFLQNEFYLDVIKHESFNPRLIEWLSGYARVREVAPSDYQTHILELLKSPEQIWQHAFEHQISESARNLLFCLSMLGAYGDELVDLEPAWQALHRHKSKKYNYATSPRDFRRSLDELEGSFVKIDDQRVDFLNPSIRDFIQSQFRGSTDVVEDMIAAATYFNQIDNLWTLASARPSETLTVHNLGKHSQMLSALKRVLHTPDLRWREGPDGRRYGTYVDASPDQRLRSLILWAEETKSTELVRLAMSLVRKIAPQWGYQMSSYQSVRTLETLDNAVWVIKHGGGELRRAVLDALLENVYAASHWAWKALLDYRKTCLSWTAGDDKVLIEELQEYRSRRIRDEYKKCESVPELQNLRDGLRGLQKTHRISFRSMIRRLNAEIAEREKTAEDDDSEYTPPAATSAKHDALNEQEIRDLFSTLLD